MEEIALGTSLCIGTRLYLWMVAVRGATWLFFFFLWKCVCVCSFPLQQTSYRSRRVKESERGWVRVPQRFEKKRWHLHADVTYMWEGRWIAPCSWHRSRLVRQECCVLKKTPCNGHLARKSPFSLSEVLSYLLVFLFSSHICSTSSFSTVRFSSAWPSKLSSALSSSQFPFLFLWLYESSW